MDYNRILKTIGFKENNDKLELHYLSNIAYSKDLDYVYLHEADSEPLFEKITVGINRDEERLNIRFDNLNVMYIIK